MIHLDSFNSLTMFPLRVIVQARRYHNDELVSIFPEPNLYPVNEHRSSQNIKIEQSSEKPQASCRPLSPHPKPFPFIGFLTVERFVIFQQIRNRTLPESTK